MWGKEQNSHNVYELETAMECQGSRTFSTFCITEITSEEAQHAIHTQGIFIQKSEQLEASKKRRDRDVILGNHGFQTSVLLRVTLSHLSFSEHLLEWIILDLHLFYIFIKKEIHNGGSDFFF